MPLEHVLPLPRIKSVHLMNLTFANKSFLTLKIKFMKTMFYRISLFGILFFLLFTTPLSAQIETDREVGVRFANFTDFGMMYKKKKPNGKFRRIRLGVANLAFKANGGQQSFSLNSSIAIGVEKRKPLNDRFQVVTGTEFSSSLSIGANANSGNLSISPGIGFVLGCQYAIANSFYVGLETIPSIRTNFGFTEDGFNETLDLNAGFNSNIASLSLIYQFKSKKS